MEDPQENAQTEQPEEQNTQAAAANEIKYDNKGHLYKRGQLVLKYEKTKEAQDSIFDMMQLLAVILSFATMFFAVGPRLTQNKLAFWSSIYVLISAIANKRRQSDAKHLITVAMYSRS